jgi:ABC transporter substrate binding protein
LVTNVPQVNLLDCCAGEFDRRDRSCRSGSPLGQSQSISQSLTVFEEGFATGLHRGATIILDFRFARRPDATRTVPIVMGSPPMPLNQDWYQVLPGPGGNITGMTLGRIELAGKRLQLLKQAFPSISKVFVLQNQLSLADQLNLRVTEAAAKTLGMTISPLAARRRAVECTLLAYSRPNSSRLMLFF